MQTDVQILLVMLMHHKLHTIQHIALVPKLIVFEVTRKRHKRTQKNQRGNELVLNINACLCHLTTQT